MVIDKTGERIPDELYGYRFAPGYGDLTLIVNINDGQTTNQVKLFFNRTDVDRLKSYIAQRDRYNSKLD